MTWHGHLARDLTGQMHEPSGKTLRLDARLNADGTLAVSVASPHGQFSGQIDKARARWSLGSRWGFRMEGPVTWDGRRFVLGAHDQMHLPEDLRLPDEVLPGDP